MNPFPGLSVGCGGPVVAVGAQPVVSVLPGPGSQRLLGPKPFVGALTALVPQLRIQGTPPPLYRGIGTTPVEK